MCPGTILNTKFMRLIQASSLRSGQAYSKLYSNKIETAEMSDRQAYKKDCENMARTCLESDIIKAESSELDFLDKDNNTNKVCT